jgi:hypothetical protein
VTYDPFICDDCYGEDGHLPSCPKATPSVEVMALRAILGEALADSPDIEKAPQRL